MKKQTKVLLAAALFTLGASFSSMAALKNGTWVLNEEGWQYADKDGEYVENEWCVSYGKEYWINEDGVLGASEWVEEDGYKYYVQSDGSKTINAWKYIFAEDDEEADEESWFFFDAKGRMVKNTKKDVNDYTCYFDEDGKLLTGWVEYDKDATVKAKAATATTPVSKAFYTDEDGKLVKNSWIHTFPIGADEDECYEGEDEVYYYAKKDGKLATGKYDVDKLTYVFNNVTGQMMDGWIIKIADPTDSTKSVYTEANAAFNTAVKEAYWADEVGYIKKNSWRKVETPQQNGKSYNYYFDKTGKVFIASSTSADAITTYAATFEDGASDTAAVTYDSTAPVAVNAKKINGVEYYFDTQGRMIDGLQYIASGSNVNLVYLKGGAKQAGKVTLTDENENDYTFYFADKTNAEEKYEKYVAVDGNKDNYCYLNGKLITSDEKDVYKEVTTPNGRFVVDYRGKIQHTDGKKYEGAGTFTYKQNAKGAAKYSIN